MRIFLLLLLCLVNNSFLYGFGSAVTYTFSGGRFGDNLLSYCHAKWIAYKYNIPLLYKPFGYSDQLKMHYLEIPYSIELEQQFERVVTYSEVDGEIDPESGFLYVIHFFPESIYDRQDPIFPYLFAVDWQDLQFKTLLNQMISPVNIIKIPMPDQECLSVAVHVRKGTGWDIPNYRISPEQLTASHPLRFAPDSFFIAQLQKIAQLYPDKKIYVYLFTDHNDPAELAQKYSQAVQCDRMLIFHRKSQNNEFINVVDDFFALTQFDCLIRADSNFSFVAAQLAHYEVVISPWHGIITENETIIDEINLEMNGKSSIVREFNF